MESIKEKETYLIDLLCKLNKNKQIYCFKSFSDYYIYSKNFNGVTFCIRPIYDSGFSIYYKYVGAYANEGTFKLNEVFLNNPNYLKIKDMLEIIECLKPIDGVIKMLELDNKDI